MHQHRGEVGVHGGDDLGEAGGGWRARSGCRAPTRRPAPKPFLAAAISGSSSKTEGAAGEREALDDDRIRVCVGEGGEQPVAPRRAQRGANRLARGVDQREGCVAGANRRQLNDIDSPRPGDHGHRRAALRQGHRGPGLDKRFGDAQRPLHMADPEQMLDVKEDARTHHACSAILSRSIAG